MSYTLPPNEPGSWVVLGSELSPFTLKVLNYMVFLGLPVQLYYTQGNSWQNLRYQALKWQLQLGLKPLTWPKMSERDELPLVPFIFSPAGDAFYDSSAFAHWLEYESGLSLPRTLHSCDRPELNFLIDLIDEFFDDWGLYMVHHNRWKVSQNNNSAGRRLAYELRSLIGPLQPLVASFFSRRQTRRLPYLFSVAERPIKAEKLSYGVPAHLGFDATHELLEQSFARILAALEPIFAKRSFLFGKAYSLADASIYGQLGMNLADADAAAWIAQDAPNTFAWLQRMAALDFSAVQADELMWFDDLQPLLDEISQIYLPLMQQNKQAYERFYAQGQRVFNEKAFCKGQAIYSGVLMKQQYSAVAKSFQVQTWQQLQLKYQGLDQQAQAFIDTKLAHSPLLQA